jgi:hypothetical protein
MSEHQTIGITCDLGHKFTLVWLKKLSTIFSLHKTGIQNSQKCTRTTIKQLHQALRSMFAARSLTKDTMSDNGPPLPSPELAIFWNKWSPAE